MASAVAGYVGKKILSESAQNHWGQEDPYFERVPAKNLLGRPTTKKRKKRVDARLSPHDGRILTKVKRRAYRLDSGLCNCCGIKFGWSSVIGFIPAAGDILDILLATMVVHTAAKIDGGLPKSVLSKMYMNVIVDFVIGLVPLLGDIADTFYRCNTRNAILLEKYLSKKADIAEMEAESGGDSQYAQTDGAGHSGRSSHAHTPEMREAIRKERSPARPPRAMTHEDRHTQANDRQFRPPPLPSRSSSRPPSSHQHSNYGSNSRSTSQAPSGDHGQGSRRNYY